MIKLSKEMHVDEKSNFRDGEGLISLTRVLESAQLNDKCDVYSKVTLPVGSSIGYHVHTGNTETYYILKGTALANDNGIESVLEAGDMIFTPDGSGHAIKNIGNVDLEFMALVIRS
ncbi:cupin domain-containing protein [Clostridium grantii]|uniref:Cupin domain-containing protein n=1 Tax=Clostridium grantii DSM 8605 TaxID=1121316 RepID=A0A1M5UHT2_9CLOT|nr:cupin domain-containing protein [Clostridium grantii]SHH62386.1 Cupin domain-containing protein [Clostridium grantii DSM 8605]